MTSEPANPKAIVSLDAVAGEYDGIFCDVWGVIYDGRAKVPAAEEALRQFRRSGKPVILVTNAPRLEQGIRERLAEAGFGEDAYDRIVTSGEVTRSLIPTFGRRVFHIGTPREHDLFEGLDVEFTDEDDAEMVVASSLFADEMETPKEYAPLLGRLAARGLPMICANPDRVVQRGERMIYCAGSLADAYQALGGEVHIGGKPHRAIYEVCAERIGGIDGKRILAIGDGLPTDITGAQGFGLDALLILNGIHRDVLGTSPESVGAVLAREGLTARYFIPTLS
ncbi:TIGR01459 family HAD-type hydrolase [Consotaella salsifontis]|uniref:HAD-superfamily class IIA hydrolase, TIGR01459 n=1 Tax=Consotaella salsifontis TaxID=1365950 RepID=A0A1T4PYQ5_9HYPH|nr:TIGR01459 family HAD-type hydrolase [Consotaella salsifontis]SJZ96700.1 HAD-superfamily class IIA hydrolase, TIGR01459 [Consotaella salsifontis]